MKRDALAESPHEGEIALMRAHIRSATSDDVEALAELGARTFYEAYLDSLGADALIPFVESAFGVEATRAELESPSVTFLIAEVEGESAGYAMVDIGDAPPPVGVSHDPCVAELMPTSR